MPIKGADINDSTILERTAVEPHESNANLVRFSCAWPGLEEPITSDYGALEALRSQMLKWVEGCRASIVAAVNAAEEEAVAKRRRDAAMMAANATPVEPAIAMTASNSTAASADPTEFATSQIAMLDRQIETMEGIVAQLKTKKTERAKWRCILASFEQKNAPATGEDSEGQVPQQIAASGDSNG